MGQGGWEERGLCGQSQYGRVRAHRLGGEGFPQHGCGSCRLILLKPNNVYVIKPSGNDSQSVSSEVGRKD